MNEPNPQNARHRLAWIEELSIRKADKTIDQKLAALSQYEAATAYADFENFDRNLVDTYLTAIRATSTSSRTKSAKVRHVNDFFKWMVMDERLKPKRARKPLLALRLTDKEKRAGQAKKLVQFATIEQIESTIAAMPKTNALERRNRALMAFTLVSGARDGAIISMNVANVRLAEREIIQHPDEVNTKASKQILTWFFPVGDFFEHEIEDYIEYLKTELSFTDDDPLFPSTHNGHDEADRFKPIGLTKRHWKSAQPMRNVFRVAFEANGMRYYNPHSFRNTLIALAYQLKLDPMAMKAWSQNMGHEHLDTTYNSYGNLSPNAQRETMLNLSAQIDCDDDKPVTKGELRKLFLALQSEA